MDVFRVKKVREPPSHRQQEVTGTLDSLHQQHVSDLLKKASDDHIDSLKSEYELVTESIAKQQKTLGITPTVEQVLEITKLETKQKELQGQLNETKELERYYIENGDLMLNYYLGTSSKRPTIVPTGPATTNPTSLTFDKFLAVQEPTEAPSKKKIFDEYISRMGMGLPEAVDTLKKVSEHCSVCNVAREEIASEGILVCPQCGSEEVALVVSDFPSFRDPPKERNNYAYKKINHLNEILNQFQAKESTEIPEDVIHEVVLEIKKRRIQNVACLDESQIREILKKLGRNNYYEHAAHILSRLNGNPPPTITPEIEDKIRAMFQEIQAPFLLYCPNDRTNFLSYSYILYKFFELLELDEYKLYFPLLKSRDRLIAHDQIWKKICDYLKWEFIQSV
jgi:hypothetical protein